MKQSQAKRTLSASQGIAGNRVGEYHRSASRQGIPSLALRVRAVLDHGLENRRLHVVSGQDARPAAAAELPWFSPGMLIK
jgi:hypothetical protein